jgi:hypothetical protein
MPIHFLNTVDLNKNLLLNARIQNLGSDPSAADSSVGQIYFNTTADTLKQYVADKEGSGSPGWVEVGSDSVTAGTGIGVTLTGGNAVVRNTGLVTVLDGTYINLTKQGGGDNTELTADLNAVDGTSVLGTRFLSKDNTWDVPAFDQYTHWTLAGDNATTQNISSEDTASFIGDSVKISTEVSATDTLKIIHDLTTRTDTTSAATTNAFPVVNSVTTDTTGHVTAVDIKTVTVPDNNTTYSLDVPLNTTNINLKSANPASDDFITLSGYAGQTETNYISADEIEVALTPSVTIANSLTLTNGAFTQVAGGENNLNANLDMNDNKLLFVATGTDDTDGVNWGQVRDAIAGVGLFQGGYNATTGLTINLSTNGSLDGANNVALDKGDYFVVTTDGTAFYGVTLEVGDMIFANVDIAANSTPAQSVYTTVIQDANIAEADSTDANTRKGVAGFDSANFTASATGWVQLKEEVLSGRMRKVLLTGGTDLDGETTFTVDLTTAARFGSGALAADAIATVKEASSSLIVYPKVTGSGTGSLAFKFIPVVADDVYTAIISIV